MTERIIVEPLPGYKDVQPFVYAGFFPVSNEDYNDLKEAVEKLSLSDSALQFEPEVNKREIKGPTFYRKRNKRNKRSDLLQ